MMRTLGRVAFGLCLIALSVVVAFGYLLLRGDMDAPDWVRERVEIGIANSVPEGSLSFDDLQFRLEGDAQPIVQMRNAILRGADGETIFELADLQAILSRRGILSGQFSPQKLILSGAFLDITRAETGEIELNIERGDQVSSFGGKGITASLLGALDYPNLSQLSSVEIDAITLRYEDQRVKRSWTVDGGRLRMAITEEAVEVSGDFALLSGRASVATLEANSRFDRLDGGATFGVSVSDMPAADLATQQASLAWLSVIDAPIGGSIRGGYTADGSLLPVSTALKIGAGFVKPNDATTGVPFRSAGSYFTFDPDTQIMQFDEISVDSDWLSGQSTGAVALLMRPDGLPEGFEASFDFSKLQSNTGGLWGEEISFDTPAVSFGLSLQPFELKLHSAEIGYQDAKFEVAGHLIGDVQGWSYLLDGSLPRLSHEQLVDLWPHGRSEKTRVWLERNISEAIYTDASMRLIAEPGQKAVFGFDADISDATIQYAPGMSPGQNVFGQVSLSEKRLVASVHEGTIATGTGDVIDAAGTVFSVGDVTDKTGNAVVRLNGKGSLSSVLTLLEQIPGLAEDDTDLVSLAQGQAEFSGGLAFPIGRKPKSDEYRYSIEGTVQNVTSDTLVARQTVTADVLNVSASDKQILVQGLAEIGGVEISGTWNSSDPGNQTGSALTGQIEISQDFVEEFGLGLPDGMVNGEGTGYLLVDLPKGESPLFELTSDLEGVGLDLGFVGWKKPQSTKGKLTAKGTMGDPLAIDELTIEANGFSASGRIDLLEDGSLDAVQFDTIKVSDWLDGSVRIQGNGNGVAPDIHITSGRVDLQALTEATGGIGAEGEGQVQGRLLANIDDLFVSEFLSLQNLSGEFDLGNNMQGGFSGTLNETVEIAGAISGDAEGRRRISISADDAGKVFSALGLLDRASQGNILVELTEKSEGYAGSFVARDLRLLDMPLFADLLNAVSVVGLLDQLNFDGIAFGEVEGEFYFSEDKFILTRASATGPSIGLSLDGTYDFVNDQLDLQGTLTPVFLVNSIGGIFNRKGEGLIGFTFNVKGPAEAPQIGVNPFSALAPSLFRDLFRKPAPETPE
ncbi:MAG: AsmA-like C-terminal region-containing protein [Paracoccaceae bacterium]|nr:AsmA-like C-terminal region-containing protein [Paracoccaceae bacterium]